MTSQGRGRNVRVLSCCQVAAVRRVGSRMRLLSGEVGSSVRSHDLCNAVLVALARAQRAWLTESGSRQRRQCKWKPSCWQYLA
eukprot:2290883-Pyramimonas_sp.AAC.1